MAEVKYECPVCDERGFKSRADWLFHLVLDRHSLKARENMQQLYLESNGNLFVISEIGDVDNSLLLEYVEGKIPSFSNFVSFKPQANLCVVVCRDGSDFAKFAAAPHLIGGVKPKFRDYLEIPPAEWRSYFNKSGTGTQVKKEPDSTKSGGSDNGNASTSGVAADSEKRKNDSNISSSSGPGRKVPKIESMSGSTAPNRSTVGQKNHQMNSAVGGGKTPTANPDKWANEIIELEEFIMMPDAGRKARTTAISELKSLLRPAYPNCELINVGGDFLGFNIDTAVLKIYFDSPGITNPENNMGPVRTVVETDDVVRTVKTHVYNGLKSRERQNSTVKNVKCEGDSIKFVYLAYSVVPLNCTLLFKPFKLAQTALLCKKLYFTNPQSMSLVKMVVFWAMKNGFAERGLDNNFVMYWLVYSYLMQRKCLGPVIDLQNYCSYQIIDQEMNVAFCYDPSLLNQVATKGSTEDSRSQVQLLSDWFVYTINTFGNPHGNGVSRQTHVICPRFGILIKKKLFRVCRPTPQRRVKEQWGEDLTNLGFDTSTWEKIAKLFCPDTLTIQHPLYIDDNISQAFDGKFSKFFFKFLRKTKNFASQLPRGQIKAGLLELLTRDYRMQKGKGNKWENKTAGAAGTCDPNSSEDEDEAPEANPVCDDNPPSDLEDEGEDTSNMAPVRMEDFDTTVTLSSCHHSSYHQWASEITHIYSTLALSDNERNIRTTVMTHLKNVLKIKYRFCELIPVGADFLGFNIEKQNLNIYFDSRGVTHPANPNAKRTILESDNATRQLQQAVFSLLKSHEGAPAPVTLKGVYTSLITKKDKGRTSINFQCVVRGLGQLTCSLFLRPFKYAETALLCKQLFVMNPQARGLLTMIIYWTSLRTDLVDSLLPNPFVIFWFVHFFLAKKNMLPAVLELQKSCNYEIIEHVFDQPINVAFSYDPSILNPMFGQSSPLVSKDNVQEILELLIEWFVYMEVLGRPGSHTERNVRKHYVIAPRVGQLIDKQEFKVCKENQRNKRKYMSQQGLTKQQELRRNWANHLLKLGYDQSVWKALVRQRLRDPVYIQHPFYLSYNICQKVTSGVSRMLFEAITETKNKFTQFLAAAAAGTEPTVSIREALLA